MSTRLQCDMEKACTKPVTHMDEKGFAYCAYHGIQRQRSMRCRRLAEWELARIECGRGLLSYSRITKRESEKREQEREGRTI